MEYNFYIHKNTYTNNKQGLKTGVRIEKIPSFYVIEFTEGEGPYESLRELKRKSTIYRNLVLRNSKRAQQICHERNISVVKDFVLTKEDFSVDKDFIDAFEHCIKGRVKNGKVYGVHFYNPERVRVLRIIQENNINGVWKAEIELYDSNTKKWIKKENPSTFFPRDWSIHKLFHECYHAVSNKTKKLNSKSVFVSKTKTGVKVEIICVNKKLKSIYPLLD